MIITKQIDMNDKIILAETLYNYNVNLLRDDDRLTGKEHRRLKRKKKRLSNKKLNKYGKLI